MKLLLFSNCFVNCGFKTVELPVLVLLWVVFYLKIKFKAVKVHVQTTTGQSKIHITVTTAECSPEGQQVKRQLENSRTNQFSCFTRKRKDFSLCIVELNTTSELLMIPHKCCSLKLGESEFLPVNFQRKLKNKKIEAYIEDMRKHFQFLFSREI